MGVYREFNDEYYELKEENAKLKIAILKAELGYSDGAEYRGHGICPFCHEEIDGNVGNKEVGHSDTCVRASLLPQECLHYDEEP